MGGRTSALEGVGIKMQKIDLDFYWGKRVFVTGHTGFKGAWLCRVLADAGAVVTGYAMAPPTEPSLFSLMEWDGGGASVIGDIRDRDGLMRAFLDAGPDIVFHLAAQPIVRDSYKDPAYTYETNVMGTVNVLECIRTLQVPVKSVVIVTTDKVYENRNWVWGYREDERLDGFDPYSNSKSCAELVVHSYVNSFFSGSQTAVSTARAGNVIGGGDLAHDRIIPDCVRAVQSGAAVTLRNPKSVRPYQHVLEALSAYLLIGQRQYGSPDLAGSYNVGPDDEGCVTTGQLVELFGRFWGEGFIWESHRETGAPHEAELLRLDCAKIKAKLGWKSQWSIETAVEKTVEWTRAWLSGENVTQVMDRQIMQYLGGE